MDLEKQFKELEKRIEGNKLEEVRLKERINNLEEEETKLNNELKELGITSKDLVKEIEVKEKELKEELEKCQKLLS